MNFPVKNVILEGKRWQFLRRYARWSLEDASKSEYENMSGRAGRLAFTNDFGRSILVTYSPFEAEDWLKHYVGSDFEDVVPTLKDAPLENHVVNLLASGLARTRLELLELLLSSFTGHVFWAQKMSRDEFEAALDRALRLCVEGGILTEQLHGQLTVTELGRACATKGIGVDTGIALAAWSNQARSAALSEIEVLTAVSLSPAGGDVYVSMGKNDRRSDYRAEIRRHASEAGVADRPVFARFSEDQTALEYETAKSLKKALLLTEWIEEVRTKDIERHHRVWAGALRRIGEEYAWLVEALAAVARACGWSESRCRELDGLSDRLVHGVRADALPLAKLRAKGLGRALVRRLVLAGFTDADSIRRAGPETIKKALNHRGAFTALWARINEQVEPRMPSKYPTESAPALLRVAEPEAIYGSRVDAPAGVVEPHLRVDLTERRVSYRGHDVPTRPPNNLQRQPLLALAVLAGRAGQTMSMAELAEEMFRLGGLRKRPITPDARDLRYKLLRPFKKSLSGKVPPEEIERLVESAPGVGLRLNLDGRAEIIQKGRAQVA
jgi:replicative superfamily II helicase